MTEEEKKEIDLLHKLDVKFNKLSLREHLIVEEATKELQEENQRLTTLVAKYMQGEAE